VRAGFHGGHRTALVTVERPVQTQRLDAQRPGRDFPEDFLRVVGTVVIAHAGVVAPYDQVRAAVILSEDGVEQGLARSGVTHFHGVAALHDAVLAEVLVHQRVHGPHPYFRRYVAGFELADQLVNVDAVADLDRDPRQVGVRIVHGIAELQRRNRRPAALLENAACLGRSLVDAREHFRVVGLGKDAHRASQIDGALLEHFLHSGMRRIRGAEDLAALVLLVNPVFFGHAHRAHDGPCLKIPKGHFLARSDRARQFFVGRQRDRDGPEQAAIARQAVVLAAAFPVVVAHEAFERREGADAHHDEVAGLATRHGHFLQALGPPQLFPSGRFIEEQRL
jgi:hypothetical protein